MTPCESARDCRLCANVSPGTAVAGAGPAPCPVMFVGEAPGRLGAGRSGVPFSGDAAGRRFEILLAEAGMRRDEVFITNSVLCLPLDGSGRNRRPSTAEVRNCAAWLERTLSAVEPGLVVALGAIALEGLGWVTPHGLSLAENCGRPEPWHGVRLVALYHPGARSQVHRPWPRQVEDWRALRELWR